MAERVACNVFQTTLLPAPVFPTTIVECLQWKKMKNKISGACDQIGISGVSISEQMVVHGKNETGTVSMKPYHFLISFNVFARQMHI